MMNFFVVYKVLEHKATSVREIMGRESAVEVVQKCIDNYKNQIEGKL